MELHFVHVRPMPEPGEPDLARLDLVNPTIVPDAQPPGGLHASQRLDIEARSSPGRLLGERLEGPRKPSLDFPREAAELPFCTGLEENLRQHGQSQPEPLAHFTPRDVWFLAEPPEVFAYERPGRVVIHEVVEDLIVRRAADLVGSQASQGVGLDGDRRSRHHHNYHHHHTNSHRRSLRFCLRSRKVQV